MLKILSWILRQLSARRTGTSLLCAGLLALGASCDKHPPTQIVVRVASDLMPGKEITSFRIHVERQGRKPNEPTILDAPYFLLDGGVMLPTELGVLPHDPGDDR